MALDKDRRGNALADTVIAATGTAPGGADETKLRKLMKDLANDIIVEFINNAVVETTTATPNAQSGSTTLPGTGTGEIIE